MPQVLRLLLLEDNQNDADLLIRALRQSGFEVIHERVDNEKDFIAHLDPSLDLIISDYQMPSFIGLQALDIVRERGLQIPFILISGTVGEDIAVMAMRNGASDYLMKDRLARLGEAVKRAIEDRRIREDREIAERALRGSEDRFAALIDSAMDAIISFDSAQKITLFNPAAERMFGYTARDAFGRSVLDLIPERFRNLPGAQQRAEAIAAFSNATGLMGQHAKGSEFPIEVSISGTHGAAATSYTIIVRDVTERTIAEAQVRRTNERFRSFFELDLIGMAITLPQKGIAVVNDRACEILGYSREELQGKPWDQITHPDDLTNNGLRFDQILRGEIEGFSLEKRFIRKDGRIIHASVSVRCVRRPDQSIDCFLVLLDDISERKEGELQIRKAAERFRQVVENIGEVFWMTDIEKASMIYISPGYEKVWGRPAAVLYESPQAWLEAIHDEDRPRVLDAMKKQAEGQYDIEYRILRPDGAIRWIHDRAFPVANEAGQIYRVAGVAEDITIRKEFEIQLQQRDRQLQESQTVAQIGSWEFDVHTGSVTWSEQQFRLFGLEPFAQVPSMQIYQRVLDEETLSRLSQAIEHCQNTGTVFSLDHRITRADGMIRWTQTRGEPVGDENGKVLRIRGTTQDITDRFHLESQLQQAQKMEAIGRLSGGVAHDFNNLLTVILGHVAVLETCNLEPDALESTEAIKLASKRAANLTRQLLLFARKQTMQIQRIDLKAMMAETGKMMGRMLGEDIALEIVCDQPLFVDADPGMLDQVLLNLVVNARDAMPEGGRLRIVSTGVVFDKETAGNSTQIRVGRFACISVQDTGTGIKPEILSRIFDPFFTTKAVGKGTGLGLSTAFAIAQQHGGWIAVYSEPGQGTEFKVYLPEARSGEVGVSSVDKPVEFSGGTETILIAEDEPAIREMVVKYLTRLAYKVLPAENGVEALNLWEMHKGEIDLLLTDMVMPGGISGVQLAKHVLDEKQIPVVYMSGYSEFIGVKGLELKEGVNFLPKPFSLPVVAQTVRARLDQFKQ